jgi:hypothetical protein
MILMELSTDFYWNIKSQQIQVHSRSREYSKDDEVTVWLMIEENVNAAQIIFFIRREEDIRIGKQKLTMWRE